MLGVHYPVDDVAVRANNAVVWGSYLTQSHMRLEECEVKVGQNCPQNRFLRRFGNSRCPIKLT